MTQTKRIYLDVDGVLNCVAAAPSPEESGWHTDSWNLQKINGFPILWSSELVSAINDIVADGVEIRWLTTWCEFAQELIAPALGLVGGDRWELTGGVTSQEADLRAHRSFGWWKLPIFEADDRPGKSVWIDDDHDDYTSGRSQTVIEMESDGSLLRVKPDEWVGLTRDHITEIRNFLEI